MTRGGINQYHHISFIAQFQIKLTDLHIFGVVFNVWEFSVNESIKSVAI